MPGADSRTHRAGHEGGRAHTCRGPEQTTILACPLPRHAVDRFLATTLFYTIGQWTIQEGLNGFKRGSSLPIFPSRIRGEALTIRRTTRAMISALRRVPRWSPGRRGPAPGTEPPGTLCD